MQTTNTVLMIRLPLHSVTDTPLSGTGPFSPF